jgi:hypothetical protein
MASRRRPNEARCAEMLTPKPHDPQARKQIGISDLRPAQDDRRASQRSDQGGQGPAQLPAQGPGKGQFRVAPDRCQPQPAQAVPVPPSSRPYWEKRDETQSPRPVRPSAVIDIDGTVFQPGGM